MKIALGAKLTTGLSLTPQLQQAIRLLQLSSIELEQEVQQKLDSNPLLERIEQDEFGNDTHRDDLSGDFLQDDFSLKNSLSKSSQDNYQDDCQDDYQDYGSDAIDSSEYFASNNLEMAIDSDWGEVYTHESPTALHADIDELDDAYKFSTRGNIQDHVRWQLNFKHLSDIEMVIAEYLIDSMDEKGFIRLTTDELFASLDTMLSFYQVEEVDLTLENVEAVVKQIQSCEPLGVGSRNLSECLLLQLNHLPNDSENLENAKKLLSYPDLIIANNINALLKETNLNIEDIQPALALIRTLDPNPASAYQQSQSQFDFGPESYDIPDVLVVQHKDSWQVSLNSDTLPKLRINQEYANLIKRNDESAQNLYLREHLNDARLFIRSIEERNQNLLKVATCIVKRQQSFFEHGATVMQPMILKDVADEVGLHESTVSRITTSKTMLTPKGLFGLKYFFSSHVASEDGENVSSTAISAMIKQMIDNENPKKPLSDNTIVENLKTQGIDIARRTVTKYREAMHIGSSTQRKQRF
ncbi:sigma-54 (RpoN) [Moraxella macacae 0408225]|uniref:RNA polymerase sigma-54 factor n=1 Tax=Moraxella macacae 0408225 TaxID=1230338 RepID=L2F672_9GAMM|nr:RNA polymerase factor sigma-54 [Moraxella macacae]ELA08410.1 sigma-54 (RpoN) [Moraxella macacae 0408225]